MRVLYFGLQKQRKQDSCWPQFVFQNSECGQIIWCRSSYKIGARWQIIIRQNSFGLFTRIKRQNWIYADKITLRMLVMHRSGIPNFTDTYMYWAAPKETEDEQLALILDKPANFKTRWRLWIFQYQLSVTWQDNDLVLGYDNSLNTFKMRY